MASTSPIASNLAVEGLLLQVGNGASPQTMVTIANVTDFSLPVTTRTVEVTNVGDAWARRVPTLHDMGKITFKIFWIPEETTHRNSANGGGGSGVAEGLRYMLINNIKGDFQAVYPDGNGSTDAWPAYVTSFALTGKTGNVFEANIELSNDGAPSLV